MQALTIAKKNKSIKKISVPFIDLAAQDKAIGKEVRRAVFGVFDSQQFVLKSNVEMLEKEVVKATGASFAVGVASGSDALYLALWAAGVGPGDEVITTPFTFFATAGSIMRVGAKPVFTDIDEKTFNLNPAKIEAKITKKTKAIIPVHLFGLCCEMDKILTIANKYNLKVIEDAAQSFGSRFHGRDAGTMGHFGCYSFFPTKNLGGAGDGGMLTTSDASYAKRLRLLRVHGSEKKYIHEEVGINSRLDEIQAAVVHIKLTYIDEWNEKRRKHAKAYNESLKNLPLDLPVSPKGYEHTYHLYSVLTDKRDELADCLAAEGIGAGVYYPVPMHLQPCFRSLGYKKGDFPVSERVSQRVLSLPMYPEITPKQISAVASSITNFFKK